MKGVRCLRPPRERTAVIDVGFVGATRCTRRVAGPGTWDARRRSRRSRAHVAYQAVICGGGRSGVRTTLTSAMMRVNAVAGATCGAEGSANAEGDAAWHDPHPQLNVGCESAAAETVAC